ncbi:MAG TPA: hypothetical protein VF407_17110 [Polyangiaceae bacterium]
MTTKRTRAVWLVTMGTLLAGGAFEACSSSSGDDVSATPDAGLDATQSGDGATDSGKKDSGPKPDAGVALTCPATTLSGECDLVAQNCATGKECVVIQGTDGNPTAACEPQGAGSVPKGHECCPNAANAGNCVAGTTCVGNDCSILDGGAGSKTGRCTPFCCEGDNTTCGESDPEGVPGVCATQLVGVGQLTDGGDAIYGDGCTYTIACKPFGVQKCATGDACLLQSDGTSFRCSSIFNAPGLEAGAPCSFSNACADGYECLGPLDGGATCTTMCLIHDAGSPPFDASSPTLGQCPSGKQCLGTVTGAPPWYGFCVP